MKSVVRELKNTVLNFDEAEVRVREATSNEDVAAPVTLLAQIAEDSRDKNLYNSVLNMILKRLTDYNIFNHVNKAMVLIEYLLTHGDQRFVVDMRNRKVVFKRLLIYKYYLEEVESGEPVRVKAQRIYDMLENDHDLQKQRAGNEALRLKIKGVSSSGIAKETQPPVVRPEEPQVSAAAKNQGNEEAFFDSGAQEPEFAPSRPDDPAKAAPKKKKKKKKDGAPTAAEAKDAEAQGQGDDLDWIQAPAQRGGSEAPAAAVFGGGDLFQDFTAPAQPKMVANSKGGAVPSAEEDLFGSMAVQQEAQAPAAVTNKKQTLKQMGGGGADIGLMFAAQPPQQPQQPQMMGGYGQQQQQQPPPMGFYAPQQQPAMGYPPQQPAMGYAPQQPSPMGYQQPMGFQTQKPGPGPAAYDPFALVGSGAPQSKPAQPQAKKANPFDELQWN